MFHHPYTASPGCTVRAACSPAYCPSSSIPSQCRPRRFASAATVPLPPNGSRTQSPGRLPARMQGATSSGGNGAMWPQRCWLSWCPGTRSVVFLPRVRVKDGRFVVHHYFLRYSGDSGIQSQPDAPESESQALLLLLPPSSDADAAGWIIEPLTSCCAARVSVADAACGAGVADSFSCCICAKSFSALPLSCSGMVSRAGDIDDSSAAVFLGGNSSS